MWFSSDCHFDHQKIAEIRGFDTKEAHDRYLIDQWNSQVSKRDVVWLLGDVGMGKFDRFREQLSELNGTINLISGNHDVCNPEHKNAHNEQRKWLEYFNSVQPFARIRNDPGERRIMLSHYPYLGSADYERFTQFRLKDEGRPLLHGHTHSESERGHGPGNQLHVGLDAWKMELLSFEFVKAIINSVWAKQNGS